MYIELFFPNHAYGSGDDDDDDVIPNCCEATPLVDCQATKCVVVLTAVYIGTMITRVLRTIGKIIL